jgi:hypothetical protein
MDAVASGMVDETGGEGQESAERSEDKREDKCPDQGRDIRQGKIHRASRV